MITVNIATHKARLPYLQRCIDALLANRTKADIINIYFNDCEPPQWLNNKKYTTVHSVSGGKDLGASGKFFHSDKQNRGVYITIDDDLIASPGYIGYLADSAMRYPDSIVGLHGTVYRQRPIKSYYRDELSRTYYCYEGKTNDSCVDMLGTGALAFRATLPNKPALYDFPKKNSTDAYLCKKAKDNKIPLVCLVRANGLVKEVSAAQDSAIWKSVAKNDTEQTKIINSIKDFTRRHTKAIDTNQFKDWAVEWPHIKIIAYALSRETNFVEFGSGTSTSYLKLFTDKIVSFEHNDKFATDNVLIRPLKDGWYRLRIKDIETVSKARVLFIDGPVASSGERYNFPIYLVNRIQAETLVFIDDCHRSKDLKQAKEIAKILKRPINLIKGNHKTMAVI